MVDASPLNAPLYLRDAELRRGIEGLFYGYRDFTRATDAALEQLSFGRAHQRALYFIARQPGLTVSELLRVLQITKQSLSRVLGDLQARGLVEQRVGSHDRRQRRLFLTPAGVALECELFAIIRDRMAAAYAQAGPQAVAGFWSVLDGLMMRQANADAGGANRNLPALRA